MRGFGRRNLVWKKEIWIVAFSLLMMGSVLRAGTWTNAGGAAWNDSGNWDDGVVPNAQDAQAIFSSAILGNATITLGGGPFTVGLLQISSDLDVTIGAGSLVLNSASSSGQFSFSGSGSHEVQANTTLSVDLSILQSDTNGVTISGVLNGIGQTVTASGPEDLTLSGANTFDSLVVSAGNTTVSTSTSTISSGVSITGGTFTIDSSGAVSSSTPITVTSGTFVLGSGGGTKTTGTVSGASGTSINLNNTTLQIQQTTDAVIASGISGTGGLTKSGTASTLTLSGTNTFTGSVVVGGSTGVLAITSNASIGTSASLSLGLDTTLQYNGSAIDYTNNVVLTGEAAVNTNGNDGTISGVISGVGFSLEKEGNGTLTLQGANTYSGGLILSQGSIRVGNDSALGTGTLTFGGDQLISGGLALNLANLITLNADMTVHCADFPLILSGVISDGSGAFGLIKTGGEVLTLSGVNTFTGSVTILGGTLVLTDSHSIGGSSSLSLSTGTVVRNAGASSIPYTKGVGLLGNASFDTNGSDITLSGVVSGNGGLTKSGTGTLTLSGSNTYQGPTVVSAGTLELANSGSLGGSSQLLFNGTTPTLLLTGTDVTYNSLVSIQEATTINTNVNTLQFGSIVTSTSGLTKTGGGELEFGGRTTLQNVALTSGTMTFLPSIGSQQIGDLSGSVGTTFAFNDNTLTLNQNGASVFSGSFSGTGRLMKKGSGALNLGGSISLGGPLVIDAGTLQFGGTLLTSIGSLSGLGGTLDIGGNSTQIVQDTNGVFSGGISGTLSLTKLGNATLTLNGTNSLAAPFSVNVGELAINGSLNNSTVLVSSLLTGTGSVGGLTILSGGQVTPGASFGTLQVNGDYLQNAGGIFQVLISTLNSNALEVSGNVSINASSSILNVDVQGSCFAGATYDILLAPSVSLSLPVWGVLNAPSECGFVLSLIGGDTIARLTASNTSLFIGNTLDPGNPTAVVDYLDCLRLTISSPITPLIVAMSNLSTNEQINSALNFLHPGLFGAFEWASLDNHTLVGQILANQMIGRKPFFDREKKEKKHSSPTQRGWISPFGSFTRLSHYQQLRGYATNTGGLLMGYEVPLPFSTVLGISTGYYHTHLKWANQAGSSSIQSVVGGAYLGWIARYFLLDLECIGGMNFYSVDRKIVFSGVNSVAHHNHRAAFWTPRAGLTIDLYAQERGSVQLFGVGVYDTLSQGRYNEAGAPGLDLTVFSKLSRSLRVQAGTKWRAHLALEEGELDLIGSPSWIYKKPMTDGHYKSKLREELSKPCLLVVDTFNQARHFLGVDLGFFYTIGQMTTSFVYQGEFGRDYYLNDLQAKWQWCF